MAGPGRPPAARKTDQTRAWEEQVKKLQWLFKLKQITSAADFIGPLIEGPLNQAYEKIRPMVEELEAKKSLDRSDEFAFADGLETGGA